MLLRRGESAGPSCLGICGGPSSFMSFIEPTSLSLFKPDIWPCVLGLRAPIILNSISLLGTLF